MRRAMIGIGLAALVAEQAPAQERTRPGADTPFAVRTATVRDRGELQLLGVTRWERGRDGRDGFEVGPGFRYGLTDALELRFDAAQVFGDASDAGRGSVTPGLRWLVAEEAGWRPALALFGEMTVPTGPGGESALGEVSALVSRTTGRGPGATGLHLNAGLLVRPEPGSEERRHGYRLGAAVSRVLADDLFAVLAYAQETGDRGERDRSVVEAGFQRSFGDVSLAVLGGAGLNRDSPRWQVGLALKYEFSLGAR